MIFLEPSPVKTKIFCLPSFVTHVLFVFFMQFIFWGVRGAFRASNHLLEHLELDASKPLQSAARGVPRFAGPEERLADAGFEDSESVWKRRLGRENWFESVEPPPGVANLSRDFSVSIVCEGEVSAKHLQAAFVGVFTREKVCMVWHRGQVRSFVFVEMEANGCKSRFDLREHVRDLLRGWSDEHEVVNKEQVS